MDTLTLTDTYSGRVEKTLRGVLAEFKEDGSESIIGVPVNDVKKDILEHSVGNGEPKMVDDATATPLASLGENDFNDTVRAMQKFNGNVEFG